MNLQKHLQAAGVPESLRAQAIACLREADKLSDGLTWAKWKVRLFKAGKIAKLLPWGAERLIDVRPDLADWDIAPAVNITALDNPAATLAQRQQAAAIRAHLADVAASTFIDLGRDDTSAGVQALEAGGLIGVGRALEILDAPVEAHERPAQ